MKKSIFVLFITFTLFTCKKEDKYHFASVGKVTIDAYNDCGLIICIDTDKEEGSDLCTHAMTLDSRYQFGDKFLIKYRLTGDTFNCNVLGWPYFGDRYKKYPIIEIIDYK